MLDVLASGSITLEATWVVFGMGGCGVVDLDFPFAGILWL
jgi:hypothetical protein